MKKIKKFIIGAIVLFSIILLFNNITLAVDLNKPCTPKTPENITTTSCNGTGCTAPKTCMCLPDPTNTNNTLCQIVGLAKEPVNCATGNPQGIDGIICKVIGTMGVIFSLLLALAVLYFVWGVVQYVTAGGDEEKSAAGKKTMMYAIIALAVLVGVYGLILLVTGYLGLGELVTLPFIQ